MKPFCNICKNEKKNTKYLHVKNLSHPLPRQNHLTTTEQRSFPKISCPVRPNITLYISLRAEVHAVYADGEESTRVQRRRLNSCCRRVARVLLNCRRRVTDSSYFFGLARTVYIIVIFYTCRRRRSLFYVCIVTEIHAAAALLFVLAAAFFFSVRSFPR